MVDLAQWLRAQLDEDERIARAASWTDEANVWRAEPSPFGARDSGQRWYVEDALDDGVVSHVDPVASDDQGVAQHIAEHDPARVLREIDAKRGLLKLLLSEGHAALRPGGSTEIYCGADYGTGDPCECGRDERMSKCLRLLALPYADRPGYKDAWRP